MTGDGYLSESGDKKLRSYGVTDSRIYGITDMTQEECRPVEGMWSLRSKFLLRQASP